jgi:hypothetical protein
MTGCIRKRGWGGFKYQVTAHHNHLRTTDAPAYFQLPCSHKLVLILAQLYLGMPTANSNAPTVDARYVQNLTINIMYNNGTSKTIHLYLSQFIYSFIDTMLPGPGTNNNPHPQYRLCSAVLWNEY